MIQMAEFLDREATVSGSDTDGASGSDRMEDSFINDEPTTSNYDTDEVSDEDEDQTEPEFVAEKLVPLQDPVGEPMTVEEPEPIASSTPTPPPLKVKFNRNVRVKEIPLVGRGRNVNTYRSMLEQEKKYRKKQELDQEKREREEALDRFLQYLASKGQVEYDDSF